MLRAPRCSSCKQPHSQPGPPGILNQSARHAAPHKRPRRSHICDAAAVGIDLGTTNSAVAIFREGDTYPSIVRDSSGADITPSVVAYDKLGRVIVGQAAKRQAVTNPLNTFYSVKRLIGQQHADVENLQHVYRTRRAADGSVELSCPARSCHLAPQEVSAELLRHLLALAAKETGDPVTEAVITVPAYFNSSQRQATLAAAEVAGLKQVELLQEPVAAALAFGFGKPYDADTVLVFDLGGGTYDISVLESFEGIMEVLASQGDSQLGGDDYDRAMFDWILTTQLQPTAAAQVSENPFASALLLEAVEKAKVQLSSKKEAAISLPFLLPPDISKSSTINGSSSSPVNGVDLTLTRGEFEELTQPLRRRLWRPLQAAAKETKLAFDLTDAEVDKMLQLSSHDQEEGTLSSSSSSSSSTSGAAVAPVGDKYAPKPRQLTAAVLVGGATRMPSVQKFVRQLTGLQPRSEVDPEAAVALGAAIQAGVLQGLTSSLEVMDGSYVAGFHGRSTGIGSRV